MKRVFRFALVAVLAGTGTIATAAVSRADVDGASAANVQDGQNSSTTNQSGSGKSGSAVAGQVTGVVSSGRASVDARNTSKDSSVETGDAEGTNSASSFVGQNTTGGATTISDITDSCQDAGCANVQDGSNRYSLSQSISAVSGDGVGGQVIGLVAVTRAEPSIVAWNNSDGVDVTTGDAEGTNDSAAFVGLNTSLTGPEITADVEGSCNDGGCANVQDGSNRLSSRQIAATQSGDGVAGQVIGAVTNSATSIDARNSTNDSSIDTGDATSDNSAAYFAGLNFSLLGPTVTASDVTDSCNGAGCANAQDGDNRLSTHQTARSTSGDGVAGQVIGVVGSGGSVSVAAANSTRDSDVTTGDADSTNDLAAFVGLNTSDTPLITADVEDSCNGEGCANVQDGDNRLTGSQTAHSATGDGVAGEVIGIVAAGNTSLDASNSTWDSSVDTGDATSENSAATFVGLNEGFGGPTITASDVSSATAVNLQDGSNRRTLAQNADATSGDAVAGQVSGVVTGAGGSASVVLANTSNGIDATSGESDFNNDDASFIGLNFSGELAVG